MMLYKAEILTGEITSTIKNAIAFCVEMSAPRGPLDPNKWENLYSINTEEDGADEVTVSFEFNGVTVNVRTGSDLDLIYRDWSRALSGYIDKTVGPHPEPILSAEELANDKRIEAENEKRRQERSAEFRAREALKRRSTEAKLADAPPMEVSDETAWQTWKDNNQDFYGAGVITFAERWARLMQVEMANGQTLEDVASATSQEADTEGITGFMYGAAVSTLASCWKYGDKLRRWHNIDTQLGDEGEKANESGGVLNPAILAVGLG